MSAIKQSVVLPLNEYLELIPGTPYPRANSKISGGMSTSGLANVMDYGAKGDGRTNDDAAFKKAISDIVSKQKIGLLIPEGKTFVVSSVINQQLQHDIVIFAYGATIKKAELSGYGWLQLQGKKGMKAIYAGGTIDGNQQLQQWVGNPTGGKYSSGMQGHNCLLAGVGMDFFYAKDVSLKNIVMDGIRCESNTLGVISNCSSDNAANFHYNDETGTNGKRQTGAGDQGSAFKGRFDGDNQAVLLLDSTSVGGSIGYQSSFPQNLKKGEWIPENILTLIANTILTNGAQDNFHFEDTSYAIMYRVVTDCLDNGQFYQPRGWVSNSTRVFYAQDCQFKNTVINFRNKASMKLCVITGGSISSNMKYSSTSVVGNVDVIAGTIINGTKVTALNSNNCILQNSASISGVRNSDKTILDSAIDLMDTKGVKLGTLGVNGTPFPTPTPDPVPDPTPVPNPPPLQIPPGAFSVRIGGALISWDISKDAVTYDLLRDNAIIAKDLGVPAYVDMTAPVGQDLTYQVIAKNAAGATVSNTIVVNIAVPTNTPAPQPEPTPEPIPDPVIIPATKATIGLLPWQHADNLGLKVGRNRIVVKDSGGSIQQMQRYNGKVLFAPSVVWEAKAFPTDLNLYRSKLQAVVNSVKKEKMPFFALENEPNYAEANGNVATYVEMVKIACELFAGTGIEVYSGGLTFNALASICATLYGKDSKEFQVFKANGFAAANNDSIAFIRTYLEQMDINKYDIHFNFHCHVTAKTLAVLPLVVAKVKELAKGKKVMCGECSFDRQSADDVTAALNALKDLHYVLLYSEESGGTTAVKFNSEMDNAVKAFL